MRIASRLLQEKHCSAASRQGRQQTGSGLGLLIVRRIVKEHGGSITLASQPGQGTTITVFLPRVERTIRLLPSSIPS